MSGGEYAPKDSRDVTLHPTEPGKPSGWRETGPDGDAPENKLAPDDMRDVTGATPAGSAPGEDSGWRDVEGQGKHKTDPAAEARENAGADAASAIGRGAAPPSGVPQHDEPFTAEDAAAARSHQD